MDLTVSFSEIGLPPRSLRRLDLYFVSFEGLAARRDLAGSRLELELVDASEVQVALDPEFPVLTSNPSPRRDRQPTAPKLRIWRPPLECLPPADRRWIEQFGVLPNDRSPPVPSRFGGGPNWNDPDRRDVERCCAVLGEVTSRLTRDAGRVA